VITAEVGDEAGRAVIRLLALESDAVWNLLELEEAVSLTGGIVMGPLLHWHLVSRENCLLASTKDSKGHTCK
jgi:hypothetical protein